MAGGGRKSRAWGSPSKCHRLLCSLPCCAVPSLPSVHWAALPVSPRTWPLLPSNSQGEKHGPVSTVGVTPWLLWCEGWPSWLLSAQTCSPISPKMFPVWPFAGKSGHLQYFTIGGNLYHHGAVSCQLFMLGGRHQE